MSQIFRARLHGQHHWAVHQGNILRQIWQILNAVMHGEGHLYHIAFLPLAVDSNIRRGTCYDRYGFTIYLDFKLSWFYPTRKPYLKRKLPLTLSNGQSAGLAIWETGLLTKYDTFLFPVQFRRYEEVDEEVVCLLGIDKLSILSMILHTCSHTAPHGFIGCRVVTIMARTG